MTEGPSGQEPSRSRLASIPDVVPYIVLGALWMVVSEFLLVVYVGDPPVLYILEILKGTVFITASAYMIHSRARAKEALAERELYFKTLLAHSSDFIAVVGPDGRLLYGSPSVASVLGNLPDERKNQDWLKFLHPDDIAGVRDTINQLLTDPSTSRTAVIRVKSESGSSRILEAIARNLLDDPVVRGIVLNLRDVTERARAERELRAQMDHLEELVDERTRELREVERFAAIGETALMVGHDLRNPLQVVANSIYLIRGALKNGPPELPDSSRAKGLEVVSTVQEQIDYMDKIVSDLSYYGYLGPIDRARTDMHELINSGLSSLAIPQTIKVTLKFDEGFPELEVDPIMMRRVFTNLITNAMQAMPNGGEISLCAHAREIEEVATITVEDTGVGIPEENLGKVFQPFFTTKSRGLGLGLPVCKGVVEAHGGEIAVESWVGKGTRVTVRIPMRQEHNSGRG